MGTRRTLPETDLGLLDWSKHFAASIAVDPQAVGLTPELATSYAQAQAHYAACLLACDPAARTKPRTQAKLAAADELRRLSRLLISLVRGTPGVGDEQRAHLGIVIRRKGAAIGVPDFAPLVSVASVDAFSVTIKLRGPMADRRARPDGVGGAVIITHAGELPPEDPALWRSDGATGKTTYTIQFSKHLPSFTKVWIAAAWMNPRKQRGRFSKPIATNLGTWLVQSTPALLKAA